MRDALQQALRLSRQGYSSNGIARQMDVTEGTARKYLNQLEERLGEEVLTDF